MKATLNLTCDFEEIPQTVGDFLDVLRGRQWQSARDLLDDAAKHCHFEKSFDALKKIDEIRLLLARIDGTLMDYSSILAGFVKTEADLKAGIDPAPALEPEEMGEVEEVNENDIEDQIEND